MSRGRFPTADLIGTKRIMRPARAMGDLDYNDPSVIDALNAGFSAQTIMNQQGGGVTDATLESEALATGIVSAPGITGFFENSSIIQGIPNWALIALGGVFVMEMIHWNR